MTIKMSIAEQRKLVLLYAVSINGGMGSKKEILDLIDYLSLMNLTDKDIKIMESRKELKWRNNLAYTRKQLVQVGMIDGTEENNWKITHNGERLLDKYIVELENYELGTDIILSDVLIEMMRSSKDELNNYNPSHQNLNSSNGSNSTNHQLGETEKNAIIKIRIGQGAFKRVLLKDSCSCKICGISTKELLIASHIKPWKESISSERRDKYNGFLLCPQHDALFDKGLITFNEYGEILFSSKLDVSEFNKLCVHNKIVINLLDENKKYLEFHRNNVFK